jgi:hypothetical protein
VNPGPPEYKAWVLTKRPQCSVEDTIKMVWNKYRVWWCRVDIWLCAGSRGAGSRGAMLLTQQWNKTWFRKRLTFMSGWATTGSSRTLLYVLFNDKPIKLKTFFRNVNFLGHSARKGPKHVGIPYRNFSFLTFILDLLSIHPLAFSHFWRYILVLLLRSILTLLNFHFEHCWDITRSFCCHNAKQNDKYEMVHMRWNNCQKSTHSYIFYAESKWNMLSWKDHINACCFGYNVLW